MERKKIMKKLMTIGATMLMSMCILCGCGEEGLKDFSTYAEPVEGIELPE